jgi:hypothetical protein
VKNSLQGPTLVNVLTGLFAVVWLSVMIRDQHPTGVNLPPVTDAGLREPFPEWRYDRRPADNFLGACVTTEGPDEPGQGGRVWVDLCLHYWMADPTTMFLRVHQGSFRLGIENRREARVTFQDPARGTSQSLTVELRPASQSNVLWVGIPDFPNSLTVPPSIEPLLALLREGIAISFNELPYSPYHYPTIPPMDGDIIMPVPTVNYSTTFYFQPLRWPVR